MDGLVMHEAARTAYAEPHRTRSPGKRGDPVRASQAALAPAGGRHARVRVAPPPLHASGAPGVAMSAQPTQLSAVSTAAEIPETMKAAVLEGYGPGKVAIRDVERPELADDGVLVRVRASSLNRADWYGVTGTPLVTRPMQGLRGPKDPRFGIDFAGTVEAVGETSRASSRATRSSAERAARSPSTCVRAEGRGSRRQAGERHASRRRRPCPWRGSPRCRACVTTGRSRRVSACSSTVPRAASAPSPCRSPRRSARR